MKSGTLIFIYDKKLSSFSKPFHCKFGVSAGESLKDIKSFSLHTEKIFKKIADLPPPYALVSFGGGSVGDFSGFLASVFHRGIPLAHIPSTWLAAIDSAHGGKTALNVSGFKNQIGSFYPAHQTYLIDEVLKGQPLSLKQSAKGELAKMICLDLKLWKMFVKAPYEADIFTKMLRPAILSKLKVVKSDPFEKKERRCILNLGHTLAHVLELHFKMDHGSAVTQGLWFSLNYSLKQNLLSYKEFEKIKLAFTQKLKLTPMHPKKLAKKDFLSYAAMDKKIGTQGHINFIFLKKCGKPFIKKITLIQFYREAKRQGWAL